MNQLVTKAMEFASLEPISPINDEGGGGGGEHEGHMLHTKVFIGILCSVVVLLAVIGNSLVVSVIIRYKQLQNATNYILLSLAIADITVTFLVMIPAMIQDVTLEWIFPDFFCKVYNAFDITCCTASILHLLLVAIDRYIAIFKPLKYRDFVRNRNVFSAVFLVWLVSLCMSFIPIFMGWNLMEVDHSTMIKSSLNMSTTTTTTTTTTTKYICSIEANVTYAIISSSLSFWIPLVVMTLLYIRIYIVAKRQAAAMAQFANMHQNLHNNSHHSQHNNHNHNGNNHHENSISKPHQNHNSLASNHQTKSGGFRNSSKSTVISRDISLSTNIVSGGGGGIKPSNSTTVVAVANMNDQQLHELNRILAENGAVGDESTMAARNSDDVTASVVINAGSVSNGAPATHNNGTTGGDKKSRILRLIKQLKSIEKRRSKDTKAIKTLGIIMGIFIICWLPFFYMYMYCALTKKSFDWKLERLITWTGYVNSFINPIVYALTNKDFRKAYMSTLKLVSEKICPDKVYQMTFEKKPTKSSSGLNFDSSSPGSRSTRFKAPINMLRNSISRHRSCKKTSDNNNSNTNRQQQEEEEREVMVNKKEKEAEQKTPIYNNNNKIESNHQTVDHNNNEIVSSNNIINNDTEVNVNNVKLKSNFSEDVKNFDYIDYDTMFNESGNNTPKSPLRKAIGNGGPVVGAVINETTTAITTITKTVPKKASTKLSLTSFLYRNRLSSKTAGNNSNQQSDKDNNEIILCRV